MKLDPSSALQPTTLPPLYIMIIILWRDNELPVLCGRIFSKVLYHFYTIRPPTSSPAATPLPLPEPWLARYKDIEQVVRRSWWCAARQSANQTVDSHIRTNDCIEMVSMYHHTGGCRRRRTRITSLPTSSSSAIRSLPNTAERVNCRGVAIFLCRLRKNGNCQGRWRLRRRRGGLPPIPPMSRQRRGCTR